MAQRLIDRWRLFWQVALTKFLFLFALGIILPTGFLVYLGLSSIRAEGLLIHKQTQERVGQSAQAMAEQVQATIDNYLATFVRMGSQVRWQGNALTRESYGVLQASLKQPSIESMVVLAGDRVVFPVIDRPDEAQISAKLPPLRDSLVRRIDIAENKEFQSKDYLGAAQEYLAIASQINQPRWQATLMTRAAGAQAKNLQFAEAETQYREILERFSQEVDEAGYPFGLTIAYELGELQRVRHRPDYAAESFLRLLQELLSGRWGLTWTRERFFITRLRHALEPLGSARPNTQARFQSLLAQLDKRAALYASLRQFQEYEWPRLKRRLREANRLPLPTLLLHQPDTLHTYIPLLNSDGDPMGALVSWTRSPPPFATLRDRLDELALASNTSIILETDDGGSLLRAGAWDPSVSPVLNRLVQNVVPPLRIRVAEVRNLALQTSATRRRKISIFVVILASGVILIALYATWYAMSREVEIARLKANFVASMSHELKTPLSIISVLGEKLRLGRYASASEVKEYYEMLGEETERLKSLIAEVLDFSRLMENRKPYVRSPQDLVSVVRESTARISESVRPREPRIDLELPEHPVIFPVDREAMGRALLNVLDNAIRYSPPHHTAVCVKLEQSDRTIRIQVIDQGYGIASDETSQIFDRFYRGKSSTAHGKTSGAGLGLSIVRHIITAHNGRVFLKSEWGKGTEVTIELPRQEAV